MIDGVADTCPDDDGGPAFHFILGNPVLIKKAGIQFFIQTVSVVHAPVQQPGRIDENPFICRRGVRAEMRQPEGRRSLGLDKKRDVVIEELVDLHGIVLFWYAEWKAIFLPLLPVGLFLPTTLAADDTSIHP